MEGSIPFVNPNKILFHGSKNTLGIDMPLGFDDEIVTVVTHFYKPGDRIFCGSDGLSDLKNPIRKPFGEKRSKEIVKKALESSDINNILPVIHEKITRYKKDSDQPDDLTLVLIGL